MISTRCCCPTVILSIRASGSTLRPKLPELDHSLTSGRVIEEDARLVRLHAEHDVLGHRHDGDQHEVLVPSRCPG